MSSIRTSLHLCLIAVLVAAAIVVAGCSSVSPGGIQILPSSSPATTAPVVTPEGTCQFTNCHGLDLGCGMSEPRMCTMEYKLGDKCRQFAHCNSSGGTCTLVTDPAFATCKACVDRCLIGAGIDSLAASDCEAKC